GTARDLHPFPTRRSSDLIRDPDPVIFFEAKSLYHAAKEEVPDESEVIPIGRAQVAREGDALTLVAYGAMPRVALEAADVLRAERSEEHTSELHHLVISYA